jgi:hypothetical protein
MCVILKIKKLINKIKNILFRLSRTKYSYNVFFLNSCVANMTYSITLRFRIELIGRKRENYRKLLNQWITL